MNQAVRARSVPKARAESVQLDGEVLNITYRNEEKGYFVARVKTEKPLVPGSLLYETTVTGFISKIAEGMRLVVRGTWQVTQYGRQIKADHVEVHKPRNPAGVIKYLTKTIDGVGPAFAQRLVEYYGPEILTILEQDPQRLLRDKIPGIGKKRIESLIGGIKEDATMVQAKTQLLGWGLTHSQVERFLTKNKEREAEAVQELEVNPYMLVSLKGVGFLMADRIARNIGIAVNSPFRCGAALLHVMSEAADQGSCGLALDDVLTKTHELTGNAFTDAELQQQIDLLSEGQRSRMIQESIDGLHCVFLREIHQRERLIARKLVAMSKEPVDGFDDLEAAINAVEESVKMRLEQVQRAAVRTTLRNKVAVLTGGPGTGKTSTTRVILELYRRLGLRLAIAAPTGKAAKRATEATGFKASTLHRLLEVEGDGFKRNKDNPLEYNVIVLDEGSMIDVRLMYSLLAALPPQARLLIVGDSDQIPSIGPGKVLDDIVRSQCLPTTRLTQVFRQAADSRIIQNAHRINAGEMPYGPPGLYTDFEARLNYKREDREALAMDVVSMYLDLRSSDAPAASIQILSATRRGPTGTVLLNASIQAALWAEDLQTRPCLDMGNNNYYYLGDRIIQNSNDYNLSVFNGEIGTITKLDEKSRQVVVRFDDDREVAYTFEQLRATSLAYAITVHRSQGSEFQTVLCPVDYSQFMLLKRNILYTAVTRAKSRFVLFGEPGAVRQAISSAQVEDRKSTLITRLKEYVEGIS